MRAQFNKTGTSTYHLRLHPNVLPAVTINVPQQPGRAAAERPRRDLRRRQHRLVVRADQQPRDDGRPDAPAALPDEQRLAAHRQGPHQLLRHRLPRHAGRRQRRRQRQHATATRRCRRSPGPRTFSPGIYARPNGGTDWALQDIHALSHEIAEWADDPFVNNTVEPWLTPTAPQYGCTDVLETGDPVVAIGFAMGTNTFQQGPNPNGTQSADGYYHPEDEVFLPWFMRTAPNHVSEPTQSQSTRTSAATR